MTQTFKALLLGTVCTLLACQDNATDIVESVETPTASTNSAAMDGMIHPELWPTVKTPPLNPEVEARVDDLLSKLTLEQKVGQVVQADSGSVTPEDVKTYRLGSVLSGGNSAPGPLPYADTKSWLEAADAYWEASVDPEGVEVAIPMIWGIDAVHGHANLTGAVVFPHNIGLGAANDPDLIEEISAVTGRELSVSGHDWTFAPTLAVPQNDRWGRTYEGFSEDPRIVASYGDRIVYGLQGRMGTPEFMGEGKVITSAKHFVGDGGTEDGTDQGDAKISEAELRDIHAAGYQTAVAAGAQTVMASFSAWQGQRMHGQKELLTDVLKDRMDFKGFVIGDWNGHGLIPGCTATDCPESLNAGLDMYMAPDSWKGIYESTLAAVKTGEIPMERLDDAVRRVLRVKVQSGIMDKPKPSERALAGKTELLGSAEHRDVARRAVRQSMVLLKNKDNVLPLDGSKTVLVIGDGADSISKVAGGWTLSWQGGGYPNEEFPNGESVLDGIRTAVEAKGGKVIFDADGVTDEAADVVIAIYGEDPYAEFQGDVENVDYVPNDAFDVGTLEAFQAAGTPVVSVFLSGRPMWVNPEMNDSDAFVAAFLPGSEGGGIADVLFQVDASYDFTGRLSYSWPRLATDVELNIGDEGYDPLFAVGYGLSYGDASTVGDLPETSGLAANAGAAKGVMFEKGATPDPWRLTVDGTRIDGLPHDGSGVMLMATDHEAQEDGLRVKLGPDSGKFALQSGYGVDYRRETVAAMELVFNMKSFTGSQTVQVGMACQDGETCEASLPVALTGDWQEKRLSLSCFADRGVGMDWLKSGLILSANADADIGLSHVRISEDTNARADCGDK